MMGNPWPEPTVRQRDDLQYLSDRLGRIRFRPRESFGDELLLTRRPPREPWPAESLHPLIGPACGTLLLGVLIYFFWHAMLQAAR